MLQFVSHLLQRNSTEATWKSYKTYNLQSSQEYSRIKPISLRVFRIISVAILVYHSILYESQSLLEGKVHAFELLFSKQSNMEAI